MFVLSANGDMISTDEDESSVITVENAEETEWRAARDAHRPWHRVHVCLAGELFEDAVRGSDREDAMREAEANWCTHTPYTPATSVLYCGLDDERDPPCSP